MAGVTSRDTRRDTHVTHGPAKAGSVTRWSSPPLGGAQCHAHAPTVTEDWDKLWSDPEAYYDGPVDADLSGSDLTALASFWSDAQHSNRVTMRTWWPEYRGRIPNQLAAQIIDDIEGSK